jgi:hypothetical protein
MLKKLLNADGHIWPRYAPYWKLIYLPREGMTSVFHMSHNNNVINSLFISIPIIDDDVCFA